MNLRDKLLLGTMITVSSIMVGTGLVQNRDSKVEEVKLLKVTTSETFSDAVKRSERVSKEEAEEVEGKDIKKPVKTPTPVVTETPTPTPKPVIEEPVVEESTEEYYCTEEYTDVGSPGDESEDSYESTLTYYGDCTVTFYCNCESCCGSWSNDLAIGAAGVSLTPWYSCANGSLPFGTEIYVEGIGYLVVQDRGVGGDWIDIFVSSHDEIPSYGITTASVYIVG